MNYACMLFILITVCYSALAPIMATHAKKSDVGGAMRRGLTLLVVLLFGPLSCVYAL